MLKKEEREMKLREICTRISKITYIELQDKFSTEFIEKIYTEIEQSNDLTIENSIVRYKNKKTIDNLSKGTPKYDIDILQNKNLKFQKSENEKIQYLISKIDTPLQETNHISVGI